MKLSTLTDRLSIQKKTGFSFSSDPEVTAVCYDSRNVVPGAVFVAIKGFLTDGHQYIAQAVKRGAVAVVCQDLVQADALIIRVTDSRAALAALACRFYRYPAEQMTLVGITGTNGKTTVTYLLEQILEKAKYRVGIVGTVNYRFAGNEFQNPVTTPESLELQEIFRRMVDEGVTHVVMEVSSHALDLSRVDGCRYDLAVFTNLTQDHLDYHNNMDQYWACKKRLFFDYLKPVDGDHPIRSVANENDPKGEELVRSFGSSILGTSIQKGGDIYPETVVQDRSGIRGSIATPCGPIPFNSKLVGNFNLENILSAVGAAIALGVDPAAISSGIDATSCIPGRLERIEEEKRTVFVDYAHTPNALENAIAALRPLTPGRLITVFGCGGDRDNSKRPVMGKIAAQYSDLAVITSDNPRSEDPLAIISQVEEGVRQACIRRLNIADMDHCRQAPGYLVESDRKKAIETAISAAENGDTVLIAGKGHETYQILADKTIPFDDREIARTVLASIIGKGV